MALLTSRPNVVTKTFLGNGVLAKDWPCCVPSTCVSPYRQQAGVSPPVLSTTSWCVPRGLSGLTGPYSICELGMPRVIANTTNTLRLLDPMGGFCSISKVDCYKDQTASRNFGHDFSRQQEKGPAMDPANTIANPSESSLILRGQLLWCSSNTKRKPQG